MSEIKNVLISEDNIYAVEEIKRIISLIDDSLITFICSNMEETK